MNSHALHHQLTFCHHQLTLNSSSFSRFFGGWQRRQLTKWSSSFPRWERLKQNVHHKQLTGMMKGCLLTTTSAAAAAVFSDKLSHWLGRRCIEQPRNSHPRCCLANQKPCRNVLIRSVKVLSSQPSQAKPNHKQDNDTSEYWNYD